jgi:hypothetical protein
VASLVAAVTIGSFAVLHAVILWFLPGLTRRDVHLAVTQAYRQLANEGWLDLKRHHCAIVRARPLREGVSRNAVASEMMKSARKLERGTV